MARRTLIDFFAGLADPRVPRTRRHRLDDILVIALTAMLSGATTFEEVETFAEAREAWLRRFLTLPAGLPSHDTIYRVFCALDRKVFAACFAAWIADVTATLGLRHIAVDGKSLRGSRAGTFTGCVHLVGAWATEQGLSLGQVAVEDKSSEVAAIPVLLKALDSKGSLVTIDAAGCHEAVVDAVRDGGGDYLICVKANQPKLLAGIAAAFAAVAARDFEGVAYTMHSSSQAGHGREEERHVTVLDAPADLSPDWRDVRAVVQVNRERVVKGRRTSTTHYYFSSLKGTAEQLGRLVRRHWAIENELHWCLDVTFGEDGNRTRDRNASANLGVVRRTVLSLLTRSKVKGSKKSKAFQAALSTDVLEEHLRLNAVI